MASESLMVGAAGLANPLVLPEKHTTTIDPAGGVNDAEVTVFWLVVVKTAGVDPSIAKATTRTPSDVWGRVLR